MGQSSQWSGAAGSDFYSHMRGEGKTVDATESEDNYLDEEIKEIQHSIHC